jgi:cytoskeletal protein CcmA (bactofilin family)
VVRGNIIAKDQSNATLRVVEGGRIEGEIHTPNIIINGCVKGDVHSSEHIELAAKAQIEGNVHYSLIEMVKGAQVNGKLLYASGKSPATPIATPIAKTAAQNTVKVD